MLYKISTCRGVHDSSLQTHIEALVRAYFDKMNTSCNASPPGITLINLSNHVCYCHLNWMCLYC